MGKGASAKHEREKGAIRIGLFENQLGINCTREQIRLKKFSGVAAAATSTYRGTYWGIPYEVFSQLQLHFLCFLQMLQRELHLIMS